MTSVSPAGAVSVDQSGQASDLGRRGGGSFTADASATDAGALRVTTSATGGPPSGAAVARASVAETLPRLGHGRVDGFAAVDEGVYRVRVTLTGADQDTATVGARASATSAQLFVSTTPALEQTEVLGGDFETIPSRPDTVVLETTVTVDEPTRLFITASVSASSRADGRGSSATADIVTDTDTATINIDTLG